MSSEDNYVNCNPSKTQCNGFDESPLNCTHYVQFNDVTLSSKDTGIYIMTDHFIWKILNIWMIRSNPLLWPVLDILDSVPAPGKIQQICMLKINIRLFFICQLQKEKIWVLITWKQTKYKFIQFVL